MAREMADPSVRAKSKRYNEVSNVLGDIKVLDLTRVLAGPWCTQSLADLGATVYKVEQPGLGDEWRFVKPLLSPSSCAAVPATSTAYASLNRGKQSITVNISKPAGQEIIRALAKKCDVIVENYKGGSLARYGLDYANIRQVNPDIIYCSITGYGPDGPAATLPGYDPVFQAITGIMSTCGVPDGMPGAGPQRTTVPFIDVMTGITSTSAVLAALLQRNQGGGGQFLDIALLDVALASVTPYAQAFLSEGTMPTRHGNASLLYAPSNTYGCSGNRHIFIQIGNDAQFERMCRVLELRAWLEDDRFKSNAARKANSAEIDAKMEVICGSWDVHELAKLLGDAGVPCGAVNTLEEAFEHPQVRHREIKMALQDPVYGTVPYVRNPLNRSFPPPGNQAIPLLGQHTASVLSRELSIDAAQFEELRMAGIV
jgi:crotonobetainyl-CoA:carnitine CoA-transferase CaiB-like acyl-CoA transferase